jgi:hypothetical protein
VTNRVPVGVFHDPRGRRSPFFAPMQETQVFDGPKAF